MYIWNKVEKKNETFPVLNGDYVSTEKRIQCAVCMEDFKLAESVSKLACDHLFHKSCIVPWLERVGFEE